MQYYISRLDRTANLDDMFIVIKSKFGHKPTKEEIRESLDSRENTKGILCSDEELSKTCNEILLSELKALGMLPNALQVLQQHL